MPTRALDGGPEVFVCDDCKRPYACNRENRSVGPTHDLRLCDRCFRELVSKIDNPRSLDAVPTGPLVAKPIADVLAKIGAEGDQQQWESSGYSCLMLRTPFGNLCGYVSVPPEHPWHGLPFNARVTPLSNYDGPTMDEIAPNVLGSFVEALSDHDDGMLPIDLALRVHGYAARHGRSRSRMSRAQPVRHRSCTAQIRFCPVCGPLRTLTG